MKGQVVVSSVHSTGKVLIQVGSLGINANLMVWQNGPESLYWIYFDKETYQQAISSHH